VVSKKHSQPVYTEPPAACWWQTVFQGYAKFFVVYHCLVISLRCVLLRDTEPLALNGWIVQLGILRDEGKKKPKEYRQSGTKSTGKMRRQSTVMGKLLRCSTYGVTKLSAVDKHLKPLGHVWQVAVVFGKGGHDLWMIADKSRVEALGL
jgi:hypothetical protein